MSTCEGKPRFPLSVVREFKYRAILNEYGEVLETDSFKNLYRFTRQHLRGEVLNNLNQSEYRHGDATLQYGYETRYEIRKGYWYSEWTCIRDYGSLWVSSVSEQWYDEDKDVNIIIRGTDND